jgi:hypothetical protein
MEVCIISVRIANQSVRVWTALWLVIACFCDLALRHRPILSWRLQIIQLSYLKYPNIQHPLLSHIQSEEETKIAIMSVTWKACSLQWSQHNVWVKECGNTWVTCFVDWKCAIYIDIGNFTGLWRHSETMLYHNRGTRCVRYKQMRILH